MSEAPAHIALDFPDNRLLIDLVGEVGRNLILIESRLGVSINQTGNRLVVTGDAAERAAEVLAQGYERLERGRPWEAGDIEAAIRLGPAPVEAAPEAAEQLDMFQGEPIEIRTRKKTVEPRTPAQSHYARQLFGHELTFGLGPAGTGKTYIAVAAAVHFFVEGRVERIVLSRPAVEAGERLGFLPGDMKEKVDPYMQPLYDALGDFLPGKQLARMMEEKRIEIAPLAFMRGRTLSNAFILIDEAQNTTSMQMKMLLTRLGEGGRMAITGDPSQIDLPRGVTSGLVEAARILDGVAGIAFTRFSSADVVRHPLVQRIIEAYDADA